MVDLVFFLSFISFGPFAQFEDFFEEVYQELSKFGEISEMNVCDNLGDHLIGNVYVKVSSVAGFCLMCLLS